MAAHRTPRAVRSRPVSMDTLVAGDEHLRAGRWDEARRAYDAALAEEESAAALEGLGLALRWLEEFPSCFEAQERAYLLYRSAGEARAAARMANRLGRDHLIVRADAAVAGGWLARAARLLEGGGECPERGWHALREGQIALYGLHDAGRAEEKGRVAQASGAGAGDLDLEMAGLALAGLARVLQGRVQAGMAALDEASAAAVSGELVWHDVAGGICCDLIVACEHVQDFERAGQWCAATAGAARHSGHGGLLGVCRAHYASVLTLKGDWSAAEAELEGAAELFDRTARGLAYEAVLRLAELRRRQGRLDEAEKLCGEVSWSARAAFCRARIAHERGDRQAAADALEAHLRAVPASDRLGRLPALGLAVRLRLDSGDVEGAHAAAAELTAAANSAGTRPLQALRDLCEARLERHEGAVERARERLEDVVAAYARAGLPFEEAEARLELADVLVEAGRDEAAGRERDRASALFGRLGCEERAARAERWGRGELTPRETEVLRLVADGLSDDEIAERLVLSPHTVHRHVANIRTKLRQSSRAGAVARAARDGLI
jgi:DNA-binding CsgD family transcriptional regulator/predicted negative regulator of RcsB-dependent stress response